MRLELSIRNTENVGTPDLQRYTEIFEALITSGGLTGVKGGKTIIHFDAEGTFQGIQLDYMPWRRKRIDLPSK